MALAVGTAVKLFPAAALPIVLARPFARRDRRAVIGGAAAFAAVLGATFAPTIAAPFSGLESLRRYSVGIEPNVDSIWGLGREVARAIGSDPIGLSAPATRGGTVATFALAVLPAAARSDRPAAAAGLAVTTVMLWSRLYSPQYTLWLLPFFALAALPWRTFALLTLADVGVFLAIYPLTLLRWGSGDPVHLALTAALSAAVVLRHVGLVLAWRELWSRSGERAAS